MHDILFYGELCVAALLVIAILLQQKAVGLSATFGGGGNAYASKRGVDKLLVVATVVLAIVFFGGALGLLFV